MTQLLPPNATNMEKGLAEAAQTPPLPAPLRDLWDPTHCPADLLPWLAWSLSIDHWDPAWPVEVKRARVRRAIDIQRRKGTRASIEAVVAAMGGAAGIREWWETTPPGDPYTFSIVVTLAEIAGEPPSEAFISSVIDEIQRTMPARCRFTFEQALAAAGLVGAAAAIRPAIFRRLSLSAPAA